MNCMLFKLFLCEPRASPSSNSLAVHISAAPTDAVPEAEGRYRSYYVKF